MPEKAHSSVAAVLAPGPARSPPIAKASVAVPLPPTPPL